MILLLEYFSCSSSSFDSFHHSLPFASFLLVLAIHPHHRFPSSHPHYHYHHYARPRLHRIVVFTHFLVFLHSHLPFSSESSESSCARMVVRVCCWCCDRMVMHVLCVHTAKRCVVCCVMCVVSYVLCVVCYVLCVM